jgi:radical SAM protein with 4Fe4S-binding SPASM domain
MHQLLLTAAQTTAILYSNSSGRTVRLSRSGFEALTNPAKREGLRPEEAAFYAEARRCGWIDDGGFVGTVRTLSTRHHLRRMQIELLAKCNLKCGYCYSGCGPSAMSVLLIEDVEALLRDAYELGLLAIDFTGGEFFLFPHWGEALAAASALGLSISVHTNGTPLNESNVVKLAELGVKSVQVSFDSSDPLVHDTVRGLRGAFAKTVAGVHRLIGHGIQVNAVLMAHKHNRYSLIKDLTKLHSLLGTAPTITIDRVVRTGGDSDGTVGLTAKEFYEALVANPGLRNFQSKACDSPTDRPLAPHCGVADSLVYVTADGEICLCPTMTSRESATFAGCSVASGLKHAWLHSELFAAYRGKNCENVAHCPSGKTCRGGCRSNAYIDTGSFEAPDIVSCNFHKNPTPSFVDVHQISPTLNA